MFSRVRAAAGIRFYSSEQKDGALFLSDLMKRIDSINSRSVQIKKNVDRAAARVKTPKPSKFDQPKRQSERIKVKDHPLSSNTFKLMDDSNFRTQRTGNNRTSFQPRDGSKSREGAFRPRDGGSKPKSRSTGPKKFSRTVKKSFGKAQEIVSKDLVPVSYQPSVSGDTFFYGKPASVVNCVTSRVAAVAKETLLKSNFPYKLPRSVVSNLDSQCKNPYILQKNFNLGVDAKVFTERLNEVVKGQRKELEFDESTVEKSMVAPLRVTRDILTRNGSYGLADKKTVLGVASGSITVRSLLANAHWNK